MGLTRGRERRLAAAGIGVVVVGLASLAACGAHHPDGPPAPAATPRASAPARPVALERADESGAAAAAVYVLDLEPYGLLTGDGDDFAALCSPASGWCRDKASSMRQVAAGVVRYVGCAATTRAVRTTPTDAPDTFVVTVVRRQAACVRRERVPGATAGATGGAGAVGGSDRVQVYDGNDDPASMPDLIDVTVRHGPEGWVVLRASLA